MSENTEVRSGRFEISDGAINMESWADDVRVHVTNPSFFGPIEDDDDATLSLGFVAESEGDDDGDFSEADFAQFSASLTREQAYELGQMLIEQAEKEPVRIGETYEEEE